jgi:predicted N-acetyltransferase YhbS
MVLCHYRACRATPWGAARKIVECISVQRAFSIQQATSGDFAALVAMRHQEDWAPNAWLFAALEASRLGHIVVARREDAATDQPAPRQGDAIIAAAVATAYGDIGVIGNVIVQASHRARGLGRAVMEAELAWLRARGVRFVELDATDHGRPLYEKLGFVQRAPSWMLVETVGKALTLPPASLVPALTVADLTEANLADVHALDREAFGGDRSSLLATVLAQEGTRGWAMRDAASVVTGYLFARPAERRTVGLRLGPWIARSPEVAVSLLGHAAMAAHDLTGGNELAPVLASVPGASAVVTDTLSRYGMPLVPDDVRMRLTLPSDAPATAAAREDWVYGMLAPMVG